MKNYYDELEVSKTASKEIIEKVYKVLAKKYHPDTTKEVDKLAAEEKFKIISEAYEVLSNDEKRKKYDEELERVNPTISYEDYMDIVNQRDNLSSAFNNLKAQFEQSRNTYNPNMQYNGNTQGQTQYQQNIYNQQNQFRQNNAYQQPNQNFNNGYNNYQRPNMNMNQNHTNQKTGNTTGKKYYYNTVTGQPVSASDYYKYRIKKFISNIGFYILLLIILFLLIKNIFSNGLNDLFL